MVNLLQGRKPNRVPSALSGLGWTTAQAWVGIAVQITMLVCLSRLISPYEFGVYGVALAPVTLIAAFAEFGLGPGVVRSRSSADLASAAAGFIAIVLSSTLFLAITLLNLNFPFFFANENGVSDLITWLSFIILTTPFLAISRGLLQRSRRFEELARIEILSLAVNIVISISGAIIGLGAWALVAGQIGYQFTNFALSFLAARPSFGYHRAEVIELIQFSWVFVWLRVIDTASMTLDRLTVSGAVGVSAVGYYQRATNVRTIASTMAFAPMDVFTFPRLSAAFGRPEALRYEFDNAKALALISSVPLSIAIIVASGEWTSILFGPAWQPAAVLIQIMSLVLPFRALDRANAVLARSAARQGWRVPIQLVTVGLSLLALYLLAPSSLYAATLVVTCIVASAALSGSALSASILGRPFGAEFRFGFPCIFAWILVTAVGLGASKIGALAMPAWLASLLSAGGATCLFMCITSFKPHWIFPEKTATLMHAYRRGGQLRVRKALIRWRSS
ncbi:oligosaccharide flippase family protein [Mesorhizobium sp. M0965]|uniref:oligosaccharide flippase family protein n=1 Tax=unclassified Mesorhizobium TaxID=325217 RepID=UPI003336C3D4